MRRRPPEHSGSRLGQAPHPRPLAIDLAIGGAQRGPDLVAPDGRRRDRHVIHTITAYSASRAIGDWQAATIQPGQSQQARRNPSA